MTRVPSRLDEQTTQPLAFGRSICGDLGAGERREWLVTNGLGGFASGTLAGTLTRRYHGLLIAALKPPLARTLLVTKRSLCESLVRRTHRSRRISQYR